MSEYIVQSGSLIAVADKIRELTGKSSDLVFPNEFVAELDSLNPPAAPTDAIIFYSRFPFTVLKKGTKIWSGDLYYSTDHDTWTVFNTQTTYNAVLDGQWYKFYLRGEGNSSSALGTSNGFSFVITGKGVTCKGNLNNLLEHAAPVTTVVTNAFSYLFYACYVVDFDVELPATRVNSYSYQSMFQYCVSMIKAPALPATTTASNCYNAMFSDCYSLQTPPPELPSTATYTDCYKYMFDYCRSLKSAPQIKAETAASGCFHSMFRGCENLKNAPEIKLTTTAANCCTNMFNGCVNLEDLPKLNALALSNGCYNSMFSDCTKIKIADTQSDEYPYEYKIPYTGTSSSSGTFTSNMFAGTGGTFTGTPTINTTYYTSNTVIPVT